jgi:hypothetical protein
VPQQAVYGQALAAARRRALAAGVQFITPLQATPAHEECWVERAPARSESLQTLQGVEQLVLRCQSGQVPESLAVHKDLALDAHPGYRALYRRHLAELGVALVHTDQEPDKIPAPSDAVPAQFQGIDLAKITGWIDDRYEPDQMTVRMNQFLAQLAPDPVHAPSGRT